MTRPLRADDADLIGQWLAHGSSVVGDATCERIAWLVAERLQEVARDASGWFTLFRDPSDGRLWERSYPQGHMHGGGPPRLTLITMAQARLRYGSDIA